ncbi:MAG: iron response transcriptional regulator IrrA [Pseudomonadota bacterium]
MTKMTHTAAIEHRLRSFGVRPTRQRVNLLRLFYRFGDRHVAAEQLYQEALTDGIHLSLATVYNTLNHLAAIGMIRKVVVNTGQTFFDTNNSDHHHYYVEGRNQVFDVQANDIEVSQLPEPPEGFEIAGVEIVVRLKPKVPKTETKSGASTNC